MKRGLLILAGALLCLGLSISQAVSQEEDQGLSRAGVIIEEWILGDVVSLDLENNQLTVSCIDYDTNQEKELVFKLGADTDYENAGSLRDIKPGDAVAVDYLVDNQGELVALNISVEKLKVVGQ